MWVRFDKPDGSWDYIEFSFVGPHDVAEIEETIKEVYGLTEAVWVAVAHPPASWIERRLADAQHALQISKATVRRWEILHREATRK